MSKSPKWTAEEQEYLRENWGRVSIPGIAKKLGRTVEAVKIRASRLKLGAVLDAGDYVTLNQLIVTTTAAGRGSAPMRRNWRSSTVTAARW